MIVDCVGVIPARGGSKGVRRKNLREVGGISLVERAMELSDRCGLDESFVNTDDREIYDRAILRDHGAYLRREELGSDEATMAEVLSDFSDKLDVWGLDYRWMVLLQPTSPFRNSSDVLGCIELADRYGDSVTSVVDVGESHPDRMYYRFGKSYGNSDDNNSNRQTLTRLYLRNGAVYVLSKEDVCNRNVPPVRPRLYVMPPERSFNIDTEFDMELAQAWAQRNK